MQTAAFTEFRKNASALFSAVEAGETILVTRHGKEMAQILPLDRESTDTPAPSWKGKRTRTACQPFLPQPGFPQIRKILFSALS